MNFEGDAFISYAHLDNVELIEGRKGWVANLHRALEIRVGQLLGKAPHIWRDPKLSGNDLFAETLVDRLQRVAVLVAVVSPRYLKSEWTLRELNEFWAAAEREGFLRVRGKARVFKVLKTPVPLDRTPPQLKQLLGYEFFKIDPETGKVRELDEVFGPDAQRDFWLKLDDLAHDVCALLETLESAEEGVDLSDLPPLTEEAPPEAPAAAAPGTAAPVPSTTKREAVYLAVTTSDLREQRDALQRDLQRHGYTVLPDGPLSTEAEEAAGMVRAALGACRMSIHLIGAKYGLVPEGGVSSLMEMQHELATERAQSGGFARLVWIPSGLTVDDERQQKFIEQLRVDPRFGRDADLLETFFEDLRTVVQDWLKRDTAAAAPVAPDGAPPRLYLIADQRDAGLIGPWADALFEEGLEVICPVFDGDEAEIREYHEENLTSCDGVLIFYGSGNELWVRRKLRELQKSAGYGRTKPPAVAGICLVGARTPEKERFRTHEATVMPQWDGYAPAPLQPFLARMKAGPRA